MTPSLLPVSRVGERVGGRTAVLWNPMCKTREAASACGDESLGSPSPAPAIWSSWWKPPPNLANSRLDYVATNIMWRSSFQRSPVDELSARFYPLRSP